ncbi:MAG: tRNA-(ms[2]io[6]A)-hydroxylase [Steroidobacteraceae bacterium]
MSSLPEVLLAPTPDAWVEAAAAHWRELLNDHAQCEKKAASTALALMFSYPQDRRLAAALPRLAREELRHFEQVEKLMGALDVPFERQRPGRYAAGLRTSLRTADPGRKLDLLLTGALIEARSCERFQLLAPRLPAQMGSFYAQLSRSEARHFEQYLGLAQEAAPLQWQRRLRELAGQEARLATAPDAQLRLHSGPPQMAAQTSAG